MLVLLVENQKYVQLSDDIRVYVLEVRKNEVRLGFDAPDEVKILRQKFVEELEGGQEPAADE